MILAALSSTWKDTTIRAQQSSATMADIVLEKDPFTEKAVQTTTSSLDDVEVAQPDWTEEEEKKVVRK